MSKRMLVGLIGKGFSLLAVAAALLSVSIPEAQGQLFNQLETNIKWTIFHEGCPVFAGNERRPVAEIRDCALTKEKHNTLASALISAASDDEINRAVTQAVTEIPTEFQLYTNFTWVLDHENQLHTFRQLQALGRFDVIRDTYYRAQGANPNARYLLAAYSDNQIAAMISYDVRP